MYEAMRKTQKGRKWVEKADDTINECMEEKKKKQQDNEEGKQEEAQEEPEAGARTTVDANPEAEVEVDGVEGAGETRTEKDDEGDGSRKRKDDGKESEDKTKKKRIDAAEVPRYRPVGDGWLEMDLSSPGAHRLAMTHLQAIRTIPAELLSRAQLQCI